VVTPVPTGRNFFYKRISVTEESFPSVAQIDFCFLATHVNITLDGDNNGEGILHFSFRKPHLDGELFCTDEPWVSDGISEGKLWFRKPVGGKDVQVRIWAWRR